jgi:hypothetical protein
MFVVSFNAEMEFRQQIVVSSLSEHNAKRNTYLCGCYKTRYGVSFSEGGGGSHLK